MATPSILQLPSGGAALLARVQPVVLFNVSDSFIRRPEGQARVIGTLLGSVSTDGTVDVRNSYAVPHNETADGVVAVDIDYHRTMLDLFSRVNPKEVVIGWYSTGRGVSGSDALIQDFFTREAPNCLHLTVDTDFTDDKASIRAYVGSSLALGDRQLAAQFQEVQMDLRMVEAERVGFENLKRTRVDRLPNDLDGLESTIGRLQGMLDCVYTYVDAVVEGRIPADNTIGRFLADTVAAVPKLSSSSFEELFNNGVQDLLLVLYLSNMTRAQLALAEKLNSAAQAL